MLEGVDQSCKEINILIGLVTRTSLVHCINIRLLIQISALSCHNSRAQSKYTIINLIHTGHINKVFVSNYMINKSMH